MRICGYRDSIHSYDETFFSERNSLDISTINPTTPSAFEPNLHQAGIQEDFPLFISEGPNHLARVAANAKGPKGMLLGGNILPLFCILGSIIEWRGILWGEENFVMLLF
ncbi:hypothetical protein CEXT_755321 [Caerostris extrusa]|uniref:Uncharacterized protein n=1 Tax=Caerostris extrusa TaxID=172846 RepID=A0AAV4PXH4_CAEEX|nr:hypothetical protein CEXT_755321 [Caerostris extrusa]